MTSKRFYTDVQRYKNKLLVRGYDTGVRFQEEVRYRPYLFVESNNSEENFRTVLDKPVMKMKFDSMWEGNSFYKERREMGQPVYGLTNFVYPYINDAFPGQLEVGMERIRIGIIDIEVGSDNGFPEAMLAEQPVTAITIHFKDTYITLACGEFQTDRKDIAYMQCDSEFMLLRKFVRIWEEMDLDVVTGWNIEFFDIPYLVNRIRKVLGQSWMERLSPWGIINERQIEYAKGKFATGYEIYGLGILDYLRVYKKFSYIPQESYRLDHVGNVDLGIKKIDYSEYDSLHRLYIENHQKFIEYNIRDVEIVQGLEKKHALLALCILLTFDSKINFGDVFTPMRVWDVIIHNYLMDRGVVVDPSPWEKGEAEEQYEGAYVKEPQVGMHEVVVSYDVTSLYPSLIVQHNISPETYAGQLDDHGFGMSRTDLYTHLMNRKSIPANIDTFIENKNLTLCANASLWRKDKRGVFPELVKKVMDERKVYKKKMLAARERFEKTKDIADEYEAQRWKVLQHVRKIQINSLYGCVGNKFFRWYRLEGAEAITLTGQFAIQWMEADVNEFLRGWTHRDEDYAIAMDTDSIYLRLYFLRQKMEFRDNIPAIEEFCETHLDPLFDSSALRLMEMLRGIEQAVFMKREVIADKGIWTGKKRYVLNVYVEEGVVYEKPKLKLTGIEAIHTSTPSICRDMIKESLNVIMRGTQEELFEKVREYRQRYYEARFEDMSSPITCNGMWKYADPVSVYKSKTPVHVKGALFYNRAIATMKLANKYPLIKESDKVRWAYLKEPNILDTSVVSIPGVMPPEFRLEAHIDRKKMFENNYYRPMAKLAGAAGWTLEKMTNLDDVFVWADNATIPIEEEEFGETTFDEDYEETINGWV